MFVLGFVFDKLQALGKSLVPTTRSAGERTNNDEEEPLLERSLLLADLLENEDGFSSEYVGWFRSRDASQQCSLHLSVYLLVAIIGYSFVFEDWPVTDSIYFAVVIFTTVGEFLFCVVRAVCAYLCVRAWSNPFQNSPQVTETCIPPAMFHVFLRLPFPFMGSLYWVSFSVS